MSEFSIALVSIVLLLYAAPQVRASLTDGGGQSVVPINLTLVTNSPLNCSAGLTHPGVFVLVEYRLVEEQTVGEWQLLDTVSLNSTDGGCSEVTLDLISIEMGHNDSLQLRTVQLEHGGGSCNCWGVKKLTLNSEISIVLNETCNSTQLSTVDGSCPVQLFCGGSASVPRGVVYHPINLTGHTLSCPSGSTVVDVQGPVPTNCTSSEPRIGISFKLYFGESPCDPTDLFHEGVEVSVGNWDKRGHWIPLQYVAFKQGTKIRLDNNVGPLNQDAHTVGIRGYSVPYQIHNQNNRVNPLSVNLSVCGGVLQDGLQFRWLQTTTLKNNKPRDVVALDDVFISLAFGNNTTKLLEFNSLNVERMWKLRNCEVASRSICGNKIPSNTVAFANCATFGCETRGVVLISRMVTTAPLNLSRLSYLPEMVTTTPVTVSRPVGGHSSPGQPPSTHTASVISSQVNHADSTSTGTTNTTSVISLIVSTQASMVTPTESLTVPSSQHVLLIMNTSLSTVTGINQTASIVGLNRTVPVQGIFSNSTGMISSSTVHRSSNSFSLRSSRQTSFPKTTPSVTAEHLDQISTVSSAMVTHTASVAKSSYNKQSSTQISSSHSMFIQSTTSLASTVLPQPTPSATFSTRQPTFNDIYETMALEELEVTTSIIENIIENDMELHSIQQLPAVEAVTSLAKLVTQEQVQQTVVVYLLSEALNRTGDINDAEEFSQNVLMVVDQLISQTISNKESSIIAGSTLLSVTEQLALIVLTPESRDINTPNIELKVFEADTEEVYFTGIDVRGSSVRVPTELLRTVGNGTRPVSVASVYYRNMTGLLPGALLGGNDSVLASSVLSTSLQCGDRICDTADIELSQPVIISLPHSTNIPNKKTEIDVDCVFWKFIGDRGNPLVSGRWDTGGCVRNDSLSNSTHTVCECTHLTNFAILLSARPILDPVNSFVLGVIGYIGVSLSVLAMLSTIVALVFLKTLWNMRNFVHINLCVSLILAQLTFVIGVTPHGGGEGVGPGCRTAAVIMHYLFLVSFMWMLMEGVVLYVALVRVFLKLKHQRMYLFGFFVFSYGAPLLYMVLCVPLGLATPHESGYGYGYIQTANETVVCWLNPYSNFVWTFIAPVVVVILVNVGFFIMALVIMYRHAKRQTHKSKLESARYWLKSSVSLVTVMGLTWIIGVLVFELPALLPLAYIFTIFVAFQGVAIFVIFVPLSKQVREAYSKWWKVRVAESDTLSRLFGDWSLRSIWGRSSVKTSDSHSLNPPTISNLSTTKYTMKSNISQSTLTSTDQCVISESADNQAISLKQQAVGQEDVSYFNVVFLINGHLGDSQSEQDHGTRSKSKGGPELDCGCVEEATVFSNSHAVQYT